MPSQHVIFVATGPDRPGVMDEVSQFILERGGTIADSRSTNLNGQFALLVLVGGTSGALEKVRAELPELAERHDFHARIESADASRTAGDTFPYHFTARGADQATAIQRLSHLFRVLNINIEGLETHMEGAAARRGQALEPNPQPFSMKLTLAVPRETPIVMLREYLTQLCNEMSLTFSLDAA